jgi:hypothetical protein
VVAYTCGRHRHVRESGDGRRAFFRAVGAAVPGECTVVVGCIDVVVVAGLDFVYVLLKLAEFQTRSFVCFGPVCWIALPPCSALAL